MVIAILIKSLQKSEGALISGAKKLLPVQSSVVFHLHLKRCTFYVHLKGKHRENTQTQSPPVSFFFFQLFHLTLPLQRHREMTDIWHCMCVHIKTYSTSVRLKITQQAATSSPHTGPSSRLKGIQMTFAPMNLCNHCVCCPSSLHNATFYRLLEYSIMFVLKSVGGGKDK